MVSSPIQSIARRNIRESFKLNFVSHIRRIHSLPCNVSNCRDSYRICLLGVFSSSQNPSWRVRSNIFFIGLLYIILNYAVNSRSTEEWMCSARNCFIRIAKMYICGENGCIIYIKVAFQCWGSMVIEMRHSFRTSHIVLWSLSFSRFIL